MQKKKGISLIVLVITIIVMIILAGAIILNLNNSGIILKANQAVRDTDEATVKEIAQMAWAEAYADGVRTVEGDNGFQARVEEALEKNKIDQEKYLLNITTSGVTTKLRTKVWLQDGLTVKKGEEELTIGQTVNYTATGTDYTGEWKVLGTDEEGNLLIMSAEDVKTDYRLGYESTDSTVTVSKMKECQNDWLNGAKELDTVCLAYGKGTGAISSRSINIDDINKVTGYVPETVLYGKGTVYQYGNKVTYKYNETTDATAPMYESIVKDGTLNNEHTAGFYYYDGKEFKHIADLATGARGKLFLEVTNNYYNYVGSEYIDADSEAHKMIFGEYDEEMESYSGYYWLASPYTFTYTNVVGFGLRLVFDGEVYRAHLWYSSGSAFNPTRGVRAVVTISSDALTSDLI